MHSSHNVTAVKCTIQPFGCQLPHATDRCSPLPPSFSPHLLAVGAVSNEISMVFFVWLGKFKLLELSGVPNRPNQLDGRLSLFGHHDSDSSFGQPLTKGQAGAVRRFVSFCAAFGAFAVPNQKSKSLLAAHKT